MNKIELKKSEYLCRQKIIFWQLIILALISCCTCCSSLQTFNEFHYQAKNGWTAIDYPVVMNDRKLSLGKYNRPSVTVDIKDLNGYYFFGLTFFFPIFPFPNSPDSFKVYLEFDSSEEDIEIDIRDLKITNATGETAHYDTAFYCNVPSKFYGCGNHNNMRKVSSGIVALSKGIYVFELEFPGSMSSGESVVDFSDVSFGHKKNELPPLVIEKRTRTRYCPLNPLCFYY